MVATSIIFLLFVLIVSAVWGMQIANESLLALKVKQLLYLVQPYNSRLKTFGTLRFWWKFFGQFFLLFLPLVFIAVTLLKVHQFLSELLQCQYCTSTWIFGILSYFLLDFTLLQSVLLAPLPIVIIYILERLKNYDN